MLESEARWLSLWLVIASIFVTATAGVSVFQTPLHRHVSAQTRHAETGHQYSDEFSVPRKILSRRGGIKRYKSKLIQNGHVFFAMSLRSLVSDARGNLRADFNFSSITVCQGHITGLSLQNQTKAFSLFACPTDEVQAAEVTTVRQAVEDGIQMFCCHDPPSQRCCSRDEFYKTYGSLKPTVTLAMKLFIVICILMVATLFIACVALIMCCYAVLPTNLQGKKFKHHRAPGTMRPLFPAGPQHNQTQLPPQDYGATNLSFGAYSVQPASLTQLSQQQQQHHSPHNLHEVWCGPSDRYNRRDERGHTLPPCKAKQKLPASRPFGPAEKWPDAVGSGVVQSPGTLAHEPVGHRPFARAPDFSSMLQTETANEQQQQQQQQQQQHQLQQRSLTLPASPAVYQTIKLPENQQLQPPGQQLHYEPRDP